MVAVLALTSVGGLGLAWTGQQRLRALEQELVRRQQDSQAQSVEARVTARRAQEVAVQAESKVALMEARLAEAVLQRGQLEDLLQQMSRSRDENLLADVEAALRVAQQQVALTGGAEPMIEALRQAEQRLERLKAPSVERVRRAIVRDLERVRAASVVDVAGLTIRLDEVMRAVDELPMAADVERRGLPEDAQDSAAAGAPAAAPASAAKLAKAAKTSAARASGAAMAPPAETGWLAGTWDWVAERSAWLFGSVWREVRSLVRLTEVDNGDAVLLTPQQRWFAKENLKLRILNARLALLGRQYDTARTDLREAQRVLDRYFDRSSRRVLNASDAVRQVGLQARATSVPRPDETLAALAAAQAGR